jgi:hypothetical protein
MGGVGGGRLKHLGLPTESDQTDLNKLTSKDRGHQKSTVFLLQEAVGLIPAASCIFRRKEFGYANSAVSIERTFC